MFTNGRIRNISAQMFTNGRLKTISAQMFTNSYLENITAKMFTNGCLRCSQDRQAWRSGARHSSRLLPTKVSGTPIADDK